MAVDDGTTHPHTETNHESRITRKQLPSCANIRIDSHAINQSISHPACRIPDAAARSPGLAPFPVPAQIAVYE